MENRETIPNDTAFPVPYDCSDDKGLTKREYFAAMAMQGILANSQLTKAILEEARKNETSKEQLLGIVSVVCADALIEVLNKRPE